MADDRLLDLQRLARAGDRLAMAEILVVHERAGVPVCKTPHRVMSPDEVEMARHLGGCTFSAGSFDKRFARSLSAQAQYLAPWLTGKQAALLRHMVHRYRRQILARVVALAELPWEHACATCGRFGDHSPRCGAHPEREAARAREALGMFAPPPEGT